MAGVADAVKTSVDQERESFATVFGGNIPVAGGDQSNAFVNASPQASNVGPVGRRRGAMDEQTIAYIRKVEAIEGRLKQTGIVPVTLLNMNPYELKLNSVLIGDIVIPPAPKGRPYSVTVLKEVRFDSCEGTDGDNFPVEVHPIQQAREFEKAHWGHGGLMIYKGDGSKEDPALTLKKDPALQRNFEEAYQRMIGYMREQVIEATSWYNSPNAIEKKAIQDKHRDFAMILHDQTGEELPPWVQKQPGKFGLGKACEVCGTVPNSTAFICPNCGEVLDPEKAFFEMKIDRTHQALAKLSRAKLNEMGITKDDIPETKEERAAAAKSAAKGKK